MAIFTTQTTIGAGRLNKKTNTKTKSKTNTGTIFTWQTTMTSWCRSAKQENKRTKTKTSTMTMTKTKTKRRTKTKTIFATLTTLWIGGTVCLIGGFQLGFVKIVCFFHQIFGQIWLN